jgi:hypothetical protein
LWWWTGEEGVSASTHPCPNGHDAPPAPLTAAGADRPPAVADAAAAARALADRPPREAVGKAIVVAPPSPPAAETKVAAMRGTGDVGTEGTKAKASFARTSSGRGGMRCLGMRKVERLKRSVKILWRSAVARR